MDASEYDNLARVEGSHWYYAGKREIVRRCLARFRPPQPSDVLLDCGAGTGQFAREMEPHCRVLVLDDHEESLRLLRAHFPADRVFTLERGRVPLPPASLDFVTALDVLEHVPDDRAAVSGFHELLRPGGLAVITVPAGMALWSDWDVSLHHFRRYDRAGLAALFAADGWEILHVNYTNVAAYPLVWLLRRWRRLFPGRAGTRAEDRVPPPWVNGLLQRLFVAPALWRLPFPFGVSLVLVARRR